MSVNLSVLPLGSYQANCYVIYGEKNVALIDPGDQGEALGEQIKTSGMNLQYIFITHGHHDHVGGVPALQRAFPACQVYIHSADVGTAPLFPLDSTGLQFYQEGDVIYMEELAFHVLATPGHSKGSVCLQVENLLFTGDTLFTGSMGRTDFEGGSYEEMMQSLKRIASIPENLTVYPGHDIHSSLDQERAQNPYLREAMG